MRFSYWPAPTMPWADLLEMSRHVEATGWDGIWYADHFMPNGDDTSAPLEPKPVQNPLPLMIGGGGEKVTLRITAQHADEWNVWGTVDILKHKMAVLDAHCENVGRDPAAIERSAVALLFLSDDEAFLAKVRERGAAMPANIGGVSEIVDAVGAYREAGVHEFIVPAFNLGGKDRQKEVLDQFIEEVAPGFR